MKNAYRPSWRSSTPTTPASTTDDSPCSRWASASCTSRLRKKSGTNTKIGARPSNWCPWVLSTRCRRPSIRTCRTHKAMWSRLATGPAPTTKRSTKPSVKTVTSARGPHRCPTDFEPRGSSATRGNGMCQRPPTMNINDNLRRNWKLKLAAIWTKNPVCLRSSSAHLITRSESLELRQRPPGSIWRQPRFFRLRKRMPLDYPATRTHSTKSSNSATKKKFGMLLPSRRKIIVSLWMTTRGWSSKRKVHLERPNSQLITHLRPVSSAASSQLQMPQAWHRKQATEHQVSNDNKVRKLRLLFAFSICRTRKTTFLNTKKNFHRQRKWINSWSRSASERTKCTSTEPTGQVHSLNQARAWLSALQSVAVL